MIEGWLVMVKVNDWVAEVPTPFVAVIVIGLLHLASSMASREGHVNPPPPLGAPPPPPATSKANYHGDAAVRRPAGLANDDHRAGRGVTCGTI